MTNAEQSSIGPNRAELDLNSLRVIEAAMVPLYSSRSRLVGSLMPEDLVAR
jgi:hypothetical protein